MAFHDQLTGLPNRHLLLHSLESLIGAAHADKLEFALLFLDGDRFKKVNDTHGHRMGDMLLIAATERLNKTLGEGQHAVRLGGDEFTVLVENLTSTEDAEKIAQKIIKVFEEPFVIEQNKMYFRASIGVLICGKQYQKPSQILRDADVAMYRAKESGRGTYQVFNTEMRESALEVAQIESDLQSAIEEQQFFLVYRPIIDLGNNQLVGFEALIRWQHPEKGLIPPDKFIPIAEFIGFIMDIGLWVLEQACLQLKQWSELLPYEQLPDISVNVSPLQLNQLNLINKVDEIFSRTGVPIQKIKMEITESALAENTKTVNAMLNALRERGIQLMIDDFGTGYSSLSYLDQLPVQVLKIDRKFIDTIADNAEGNKGSQEIVRSTILLAHRLNLLVVGEGIETKEQLQKLKEFNCDFGQGYLISRPMAADAATRYLLESKLK
jgi:diguanylate cyclase (GGDEF)-like protein